MEEPRHIPQAPVPNAAPDLVELSQSHFPKPFIATLGVEILATKDLISDFTSHIICVYDYSERVTYRQLVETTEEVTYVQDDFSNRQSGRDDDATYLESPQTSRQPRVPSGLTEYDENNPKKPLNGPETVLVEDFRTDMGETNLSFYVRDFLSPLEIWLFSALNTFLGYGRFVPTTVGDLSEPIWVSLNGREGHENITGQLLVKTVFGEAPPTPSFEQFTTQAPDRDLSGRWLTKAHDMPIRRSDIGLDFIAKKFDPGVNSSLILRQSISRTSSFLQPLKLSIPGPQEFTTLLVDAPRGGPLFRYMEQSERRFSEPMTRLYLAEIVLAIEDLEKDEPRHLFIKDDDIFLDGFGHIAFCDFNISMVDAPEIETILDSTLLSYMAPEIIAGADCGWTTNFWSLGVLMFTMCYGYNPFYHDNREQTLFNISTSNKKNPGIQMSEACEALLNGLLTRSPRHRIGATNGVEELKAHPFFAKIDWEILRKREIVLPFNPPKSYKMSLGSYNRNISEISHKNLDLDASYGSLSSYRTARSNFGSFSYRSNYETAQSYPDIWARASGPSGGDFLTQLFSHAEDDGNRRKPRYADIIRDRGLQLSASEELNWSGQGQHVEFRMTQDIPLKPLTAIGHGGSAMVDSVLCRRIKLARKTMICSRKQKLETMINEVEHLQRFRHPHIVQLVGTYLQGKTFAILLYPVAQWNLSAFLEQCENNSTPQRNDPLKLFSLRDVLPDFFSCLAHALDYVHSNTVKHMDIKPQNVLVRTRQSDGQFRVYLADFGISKRFAADNLSQTSGLIALTRKYCAPEVYEGEPRGRAADIFSLGCVFLEIATVIREKSLDDFADFRSRVKDAEEDDRDESYHGNLDRVMEWIDGLYQVSVLRLGMRDRTNERLSTISQMLSLNVVDRPTASSVLAAVGGPRDCCVQKREAYEVDDGGI